jgi:hypothetical protein
MLHSYPQPSRPLLRSFAVACAALAVVAGTAPATPVHAQIEAGWDSERALDLVQRARERRLLPQQDSALRNYSARAEGFVYFYLDRRESDERTLIKVDQVALELLWAPPDQTKQRIVGLRDESRLPNRMHYHLDHLTVVQDGFGDVIRMGDGDEVGDVPHPAAVGSSDVYEFRLADSLALHLPGAPEPIRVYELEVRPRRVDQPALVGSMFVDRAGGDIVRMTFTFTPASYVDRRLDYITVSLENGLWDGRYWLPHEQTLQIRRQLPELDFAAGAIIQGRMRVSDYVFNDSLPRNAFYGYPVEAAPPSERRAHDFERGIYDDLDDAGLAPPADLDDVRQQAATLVGGRRLSGLPAWRFALGSASNALRYNRAEGVVVGGGVAYDPGSWRAAVTGGYAFGAAQPWSRAELTAPLSTRSLASLTLGYLEPVDMGVRPGVPGAINTLGALTGRDYQDLYYQSGGRVGLRYALRPQLSLYGTVGVERHRPADLTQDSPLFGSSSFRPVRAVDDVDLMVAHVAATRPQYDPGSWSWGGTVAAEAARGDGYSFVRPDAGFTLRVADRDQSRLLSAGVSGGWLAGTAPSQRLFVLGGVNTLPGYAYRSFAGTRYAMGRAEFSAGLLRPWIGVRALAAAGVTGGLDDPLVADGVDGAAPAWQGWPVSGTNGLRTSAGAGLSLLWDMLRVDAVRGLNGGTWQLQLSFHREFWDIS